MKKTAYNFGTPSTLDKFYTEGKRYIMEYRTIYQLGYSNASASYTLIKLYYLTKDASPLPLVQRGRYMFTTAKHINDVLGFALVNED